MTTNADIAYPPEPLHVDVAASVAKHAALFAPTYQGYLADHGPMASLALAGLGSTARQIAAHSAHYDAKLLPTEPAIEPITPANYADAVAHREAYPGFLAYFQNAITTHGWRATVSEHLPGLVSGWPKNAFHPLIRLGYGIEFEVDSEVAAGLAYMAISGPEPHFRDVPASSRSIDEVFAELRRTRQPGLTRQPFNVRLKRIIDSNLFDAGISVPANALDAISRASLDIFAATHDFFALHLVTGTHAYRICAPFAGTDADALLAVGVVAGYAAVGAPEFTPVASPPNARLPPILRELFDFERFDTELPAVGQFDEHDIKLAWSACAHAHESGDATYLKVGYDYLSPRLLMKRPGESGTLGV